MRLAAAPDKSAMPPNVGTGGDVSFAPSCNTAVVNMPNLPPPPAGKVYQLWVLSGTEGNVGRCGRRRTPTDPLRR